MHSIGEGEDPMNPGDGDTGIGSHADDFPPAVVGNIGDQWSEGERGEFETRVPGVLSEAKGSIEGPLLKNLTADRIMHPPPIQREEAVAQLRNQKSRCDLNLVLNGLLEPSSLGSTLSLNDSSLLSADSGLPPHGCCDPRSCAIDPIGGARVDPSRV